MADHETYPLAGEFDALRASLIPHVAPPGPDAVRRTVRRRRRITVGAAAVAALVLIVGPVAGYAALNRSRGPSPAPANTATPTDPASPSTGPTASPSSTPTPTPTATPDAPDGRISRADLLKARLTLPPWPEGTPQSCAVPGVRISPEPGLGVVELMALSYGDADADGAPETVAILGCRPGEAPLQQVVVFDRDRAGHIVTVGQVLRGGQGFARVVQVSVESPGKLRAQVGDIWTCCGMPQNFARTQWRTYGWTGHGFTQTGGPTEFGPDPRTTDLKVSATDLVFGPADGAGKRHGSVTVTVTNLGPNTAEQFGFEFRLDRKIDKEGTAWSACRPDPEGYGRCLLPGLRPGAKRTITFGFFLVGSPLSADGAVDAYLYDKAGLPLPDRNRLDNSVTIRISMQN